MSFKLPIQTLMNVSDDRRKWTNSIVFLKKYFLEKIYDIFNKPIQLSNVSIPTLIYNDDKEEEKELFYSGIVDLQWKLFGGYIYEYIFDENLSNHDAYFSPTADVDFSVLIPDKYSTEFIVCDTNKLLQSSFYNSIYMELMSRITDIDFSDISDICDDLPINNDKINSVDFGKVRFVCSDKIEDSNICQQKIQVYISVNGQYNEIVDIIIYFEMGYNNQKNDKIIKLGNDEKSHMINYEPLDNLLSAEFQALQVRLDEVTDKTKNHIGRILYLLMKISKFDNELLKYSVINICNSFLLYLENKLKLPTSKLQHHVLLNYKGVNITVSDLFRSLAEYGIMKNNQRFIMLYKNS